MNWNQLLQTDDLDLDLAFTGFVPDALTNYLDKEAINLLTNSEFWFNTLKRWMNFVRNNHDMECLETFRNNNSFSMGLTFTDDACIRKLNNKWRQKNASTDVLSFPSLDNNTFVPCSPCLELGDIIVSIETAFKQAKENHHSLIAELIWLVSHGFLHLLGRDHQTSTSLDRMLCDQGKLIN